LAKSFAATTLLATRLPDRAIFFGKVTGSLGFGWAITILSTVVALLTVNLSSGRGQFLFYSPVDALGSLALGLLGAGLAAGLGALFSLRAATVRQVQQNLSLATLVLIFVPVFAFRLLPAALRSAFMQGLHAGVLPVTLAAISLLFLLDLGLLAFGLAAFKRHRIIGP